MIKDIFSRFAQNLIPEDELRLPKGAANNTVITDGLQIVFAVAASVAALIVAISAFRMIISRGNPQDFNKARDAIIFAAIGLVVCMAAFIIVTFVVERI